jgi:MFS family permease
MPLVGYLLGKGWDGRWLLAFGFVVGGISLLGFSGMNLQSGTWDILVWQISQGLGMSFIFVPLTTLTMDPIPKRETGYATALYSVMRNIGSSVGISFVTTWLARRAQFNQSLLAAHVSPYDPAAQTDAERGSGDADAPWRRSRNRQSPGTGDALWGGATASVGAQLPDGVPDDRHPVSSHHPAGPDPAKAKAPQGANARAIAAKGRALIHRNSSFNTFCVL